MAHYKGAAAEATRAMNIMKKRERAREELESKKRKIEEDLKLSTIDSKFATHHDAIESQLRASTVGLVTYDQMRQKQVNAVKEREKQLAHKDTETLCDTQDKKLICPERKIKLNKMLSFGYDEDDDEEDEIEDHSSNGAIVQGTCSKTGEIALTEISQSHDKSSKDQPEEHSSHDQSLPSKRPSRSCLIDDVDTSFLPDRERDEEERQLREKLATEWHERQQKLKEEAIEITFSYWDGSGHRRLVRMKKGNSIYQFLQACLDTLRKDFNELRSVSADHLVYVKEDLIIPHHYTFYDFIVTKARGKSGPLFSFDVHDDVRLIADATVEKDESHAGKVLLRSWYERNKHIFPASRWEPYDPSKTYEKYTISDKRSK